MQAETVHFHSNWCIFEDIYAVAASIFLDESNIWTLIVIRTIKQLGVLIIVQF